MLKKIQAYKTKGLANLALMAAIAIPAVTISFFTAPIAIAQSTRKAVVFDPPSNIRAVPNGQIICSVQSKTSINVYGQSNGWYKTDYCGQGYIHQSQVSLQQPALTSSRSTESPITRRQTANTSQAWQNAKLIHALEERDTSGNLISINSVAFAPNGQTLVTGEYDGQTKLWDLATGEIKGQKKFSAFDTEDDGRRVYSIDTVAISPDGKFLISSSSSAIEAVDLNTGDTQYLIQKVGSSFIIAPDGQTLISANADGSVKLSNIRSGELQRSLSGQLQGSTVLSVSKDGSLIAAASLFGQIQVWNARSGELIRQFKNDGLEALATAISPDNELLFTSFSNPSLIQMWDIRTGKVIRNLGGHLDVVTSIAISPDGQTLATGSKDGTIRIMDLQTRELIRVLKDAGKIQSVSFSPDSRTIASSSDDGKIMVWQKP